jgi:hypothetical protein
MFWPRFRLEFGGIIVANQNIASCCPLFQGSRMPEECLDRIEVKIDQLTSRVDEIKSTVSAFIQIQSAINGKLRSRDADHERRIVALEKQS